jgi:hypothetical protein
MVIITESLFYSKSLKETTSRMSKVKPLPKCLSANGPYSRFITKGLIKSITIYEFDDSRVLEAVEYISKRLSSCDGLPGYRYHAKIWEKEMPVF